MWVRASLVILTASFAALGACDCGSEQGDGLPDEVELGGQPVSGSTLREGRFSYMRWCAGCHGQGGRGGPRAAAAGAQPRDLTLGLYKYTGVPGDALPRDGYFERIIRRGVAGTLMAGQPVGDAELGPLIRYVKYLAPRWAEEKPGKPVPIPDDPWGEQQRAEAVERGQQLYLGQAACWQCHPAYATRDRIEAIRQQLPQPPSVTWRAKLDTPTRTPSRFDRPLAATDFRTDTLGGGQRSRDVYRAIAAGIGGSEMKGLHGRMPPRDIWALTHYVRSLSDAE